MNPNFILVADGVSDAESHKLWLTKTLGLVPSWIHKRNKNIYISNFHKNVKI